MISLTFHCCSYTSSYTSSYTCSYTSSYPSSYPSSYTSSYTSSSRRWHTAIESYRESLVTGRHVETVHISWAREIHHNSGYIRFVRAEHTFCCCAQLLSTETVRDIAEFGAIIERVSKFAGDSQPSRVFNVGAHLYKISATAI